MVRKRQIVGMEGTWDAEKRQRRLLDEQQQIGEAYRRHLHLGRLMQSVGQIRLDALATAPEVIELIAINEAELTAKYQVFWGWIEAQATDFDGLLIQKTPRPLAT